MTIHLHTYSDNQILDMQPIDQYSFTIYVKSAGFSGNGSFYHYDIKWLTRFIAHLQKLETAATDHVDLADAEGNELHFVLDRLGHLTVTGVLVDHRLPSQKLHFGFVTDQTCLQPFISDLTKALGVSNKGEGYEK